MKQSALILQNLQIDYCFGGAMEVSNSDTILEMANELIPLFTHVIAAIDWHPANHVSFAGNHPWRHIGQTMSIDSIDQELKPFHCVVNSFGAHFHPSLKKDGITKTIQQGIHANKDDNSCFYDVGNSRDTGLAEYLEVNEIQQLFFIGMPLENQLKHSLLDAANLGFNAFLVNKGFGIRNKETTNEKQILKELQKADVKIIESENLINVAS